MVTGARPPQPPGQPGALGPTTFVFLLCFILAQASHQVMGVLAVPIQDEFHLTNSQLGLLQGFAFSMAYALGGLPIARLLDGGHRIRIAATCVATWSIFTMLCGLANSLVVLLILRASTAVVEAALPPAAFSIFSQSGGHRRVARLTSIFMLAPFIGGGLVWLLGGWMLKSIPDGVVALWGWSSPWRAVFLAVGVPGLILAPALLFFGREPARPAVRAASAPLPAYPAVLRTIFVESRFLRYYFLALPAFYMLAAATSAWYPAFLVREMGVSAGAAGGYAGSIYLAAGVLGVVGSNLRATFRRDTSVAAMVRDYVSVALLLIPISLAMTMVSDLTQSLCLYAVYAFLSGAVLSSIAVPIQLSLDNSMRARGIAISSLCMSALAGSAGPFLVGVLSDTTVMSLSSAMATTAVLATTGASVLFLMAWRAAAAGPAADGHPEMSALAPAP